MISVWERRAFILVTLVQNKIHQRATTKAERPVMLGLNFCPHLSVISTVTNTWRCCPSSSYRKCVCWFMSMVKFEPQPCFSECRPSPWSKVNHYNINFLIHLHGIYWDLIQTHVTYQALCHLQYTWVSRRNTESKYSPNRGNKDRSRLGQVSPQTLLKTVKHRADQKQTRETFRENVSSQPVRRLLWTLAFCCDRGSERRDVKYSSVFSDWACFRVNDWEIQASHHHRPGCVQAIASCSLVHRWKPPIC